MTFEPQWLFEARDDNGGTILANASCNDIESVCKFFRQLIELHQTVSITIHKQIKPPFVAMVTPEQLLAMTRRG